jgi:hypothetical protein
VTPQTEALAKRRCSTQFVRRALWLGAPLVGACSGPTDIAAVVDVGPPVNPDQHLAPTVAPPLVRESQPSVDADAGLDDTRGAASTSSEEDDERNDDGEGLVWRQPFANGASGESLFGQNGDDNPWDEVWISGWPLDDWTDSTHPWPLAIGLPEFFEYPRADVQVAVWVSGETAEIIQAWWAGLPTEGSEILQFDDQRFVVTEDDEGAIFSVTADRPPDGTSSHLPIPDGYGRN